MRFLPKPYKLCMTIAFAAVLTCCAPVEEDTLELALAADVDAGREMVYRHACGSCHVIPGVREADGTVGPPLTSVGTRRYIAGSLPNTPANLARWVQHPQQIEPRSAMPDLGVSDDQARYIAAFLYTLR